MQTEKNSEKEQKTMESGEGNLSRKLLKDAVDVDRLLSRCRKNGQVQRCS
jgi:hypothetical protein